MLEFIDAAGLARLDADPLHDLRRDLHGRQALCQMQIGNANIRRHEHVQSASQSVSPFS